MFIETENCNLIWRLYRDYLSANDLSDEFSEDVFRESARASDCWHKVVDLAKAGEAGIVDLDTSLFHAMVDMKLPEHKVIEFLSALPASAQKKVLSWYEVERDFEDKKDHLLILLCLGERSQLLDRVLELGQNPNVVCSKDGVSPLSIAASCAPTYECVKILLRHGADSNLKDSMGRTPLMHMCRFGHANPDIFWCLLDSGARLDDRDHENMNVYELADKYKNTQMLGLLAEVEARQLSGQTTSVSKPGSKLRI